jgi:hypothetical protein
MFARTLQETRPNKKKKSHTGAAGLLDVFDVAKFAVVIEAARHCAFKVEVAPIKLTGLQSPVGGANR